MHTLPGIDIVDGMKRVGGNARLYLNLLSDLGRNYAGTAASITEFCRAEDSVSASQLAHKLRGIANNLGAKDVGARAEAIEHAVKAGQPASPEMLAALSDSLATLIDSISSLKQTATFASDAVGLSAEETAALVQQLRQEIAENNPGAEATVETLLQGVSADHPLHGPLASIRDAIDIFDFVAAAGHIESLPA